MPRHTLNLTIIDAESVAASVKRFLAGIEQPIVSIELTAQNQRLPLMFLIPKAAKPCGTSSSLKEPTSLKVLSYISTTAVASDAPLRLAAEGRCRRYPCHLPGIPFTTPTRTCSACVPA